MMAIKPALKLADDQMCFGCGGRNARGLRLKFTFDPDHRRIRTEWTPSKEFQGYADIVHGGIIGLVLDELMGNLLWKLERPSVTAEMSIRFLKPAHVGKLLRGEAWVSSQKGRVSIVEAAARNAAGNLVVEAKGRFVQIGKK